MPNEVYTTREGSVTSVIERLLETITTSVDAALYRFNNANLARALQEAARRGARVRLLLDRNKYEESRSAQQVLSHAALPFRLLYGRKGPGSKMHHKFAILDNHTLLTGSYNWTPESEEQNYENLLVLREPAQVEAYQREFEALWEASREP